MESLWINAVKMLCTLALLLVCVQAVPVIKEGTDSVGSKGSSIQAPKTNVNNLVDNKISIDNNNHDNNKLQNAHVDHNINSQSGSNDLSQSLSLSQKGQDQNLATPLPLLESLQPLVKTTGYENSHTSEISKEFTKKVLQAFFTELKNRPDLVDEILRRETYKLLMSIAQEDNDYSPISPDVDLTQELITGLASDNEEQPDADASENPTSITETVLPEEKEISKKSEQENVKTESLKSQSSIPSGDASLGKTSKIQATLNKELEKLGQSPAVPLKNADTPSDNKADNGLSQQLLIDPYYYYLYYDENEVPNSSSSGKKEDNHQSPVTNSNKNGDKGAQKADKRNTDQHVLGENSLEDVPSTDKTHDIVVDKIASAVRSVITRDMEKQLAKSKLALNNNLATNYNNFRPMLPSDVKVAPIGQKATQTTNQSSDEETELRNLTQ